MQRDLSIFEERIGYTFRRRDLLTRGLTHKSYSHEARQQDVRDNETFEFLGDSILGFLVAELLFEQYPNFHEGRLSKARSHLVSETYFASLARKLGIGESLLLGVVIAIAGPVGDLFESALKRDMQVKDTGRLLAAHGGVLDRIDSLLFAAVASYYLLRAFDAA